MGCHSEINSEAMDRDRHAYLIMAHDDLPMLEILIGYLDFPDNDIFIHIDRKADFDGSSLKTHKSRLHILPVRNDIRWGDISMVKAELDLLETAMSYGTYSYYHYLSGKDLPLKTQSYIHDFCQKHAGKEFIGFASYNGVDKELERRACYYHIFPRRYQSDSTFIRGLRKIFLEIQIISGVKRNRAVELKKGSQWCSITHSFACYLLERRKSIIRMLKNTFVPDEIFIQTLCWNEPAYKKSIYNTDNEFEGCLRYITWDKGSLVPISTSDLDAMFKSDRWFARKFSSRNIDVLEEHRKHFESIGKES